ncbi:MULTISPECIES: Asp23/Gls24 family envelope stress response protein [Paenibacillus]|uniref:Alkaline-shock protein n=1 Tax=Paenibacillus azoreducens TaxID=116718 RepID=A0A919YC26_9BACL|nr:MULTISPECIES: Asp23/Gls24 family envelope stress response protein [Paenibacillus]MBE9913003.1 Asp23/Gls24 family envelope stress response protein [Paenibacillus donghaensis]GIO47684.1 alkaline-shock protein [Paenibacillus azoreducens]
MSTVPNEFERTDIGEIQIAPEVIEVIAGLATVEVKGVAGMSAGFGGGIAELLGRKNLSKGVKVQVGQREASVEVSVIIEYGHRLPEVASEIQRNIKRSIEMMTGLNVIEVNVHIHDVHFKSAEKTEETDPGQRVK